MSACTHLQECPFFNNMMGNMPSIVKALQKIYCAEEFNQCARFLVNQKFIKGYTPRDDSHAREIERAFERLFPNDTDTARKIISELVH